MPYKYAFVLTVACIPQSLHPFLKPLNMAIFVFLQLAIMLLTLDAVHCCVLKASISCWTVLTLVTAFCSSKELILNRNCNAECIFQFINHKESLLPFCSPEHKLRKIPLGLQYQEQCRSQWGVGDDDILLWTKPYEPYMLH